MFNWFLSTKKEKKIIEELSDEGNNHVYIPQPPVANYEVAHQIRETNYDPCYYCHPDELNDEIYEAFENRMLRQILIQRASQQKEELLQVKVERMKREKELNSINDEVKRTTILMEEAIQKMKETAEVEELIYSLETPLNYSRKDISIVEPVIPIDEEHKIEVIDWDAKVDEWGISNSYAFVDSNYLDTVSWNTNPTFQGQEYIDRTNDLMKFLDDEVNNLDNLCEIVVDNGEKEKKNFEVTLEDINRISEQLSNWNEEVENDYKNKSHIEEKDSIITMQNERKQTSIIKSEHPEGYLEINIGPMFSGKSTKSLFKLTSMADQRFRCLYVNSNKDVRKTESADNMVSTHNSSYSKTSPKITCVKVTNLSEVSVGDFDYIAVDELQFFDDAYETILSWLNMGKYVIVASLDGDCYRRKFGHVLDLIPHANEVTKLTAYCDICRDNYKILNRAPFTARMTSDTSAELVGGSDLYKAMCRNCHDFHLDVTVSHL